MKHVLIFLFLSSTLFAQIKAVIFDYGGVVCGADRDNVLEFVATSLRLSDDEVSQIFSNWKKWEGDYSEFWERSGLDLPPNWEERLNAVILDSVFEVPGTLPLIEQLKAKGYIVGMLSNITERAASYVRALGYYDLFDPLLLSYELGLEKPDIHIYAKLLEKLQLYPEEVLFIDDREENVTAAKEMGIDAIHFKNGLQCKKELVKRQILEEERVDMATHSIWLESLGKKSDPAILLLAGANCHARFWSDELACSLAKLGFFVIRYDHRDVGLSSSFSEPYKVEDLAEDAVKILDHFDIQEAHLVGHSMGGYIGQMIAALYPKRVKSLTVVGAGPIGATKETAQPLSDEEKSLLNITFDLIFAHLPTEDFTESLPGFIKVWEHTNGDYALDVEMVTQYVHDIYFRTHNPIAFASNHLFAMEELMQTMDSRSDWLHKIHAPTLIVHGGQDPLVLPHRGGIALYKALPHAELKLFPKMGHMLFNRELEKSFCKTLQEHIQNVESHRVRSCAKAGDAFYRLTRSH